MSEEQVLDVVSGVLLLGLICVMLGAIGYMSFYIIDKGGHADD